MMALIFLLYTKEVISPEHHFENFGQASSVHRPSIAMDHFGPDKGAPHHTIISDSPTLQHQGIILALAEITTSKGLILAQAEITILGHHLDPSQDDNTKSSSQPKSRWQTQHATST
uniref:Uncharacterized protein n=1 Tax=Cannabis sativa TaxID=3483 RepID=A0A803NPY9_CANSA